MLGVFVFYWICKRGIEWGGAEGWVGSRTEWGLGLGAAEVEVEQRTGCCLGLVRAEGEVVSRVRWSILSCLTFVQCVDCSVSLGGWCCLPGSPHPWVPFLSTVLCPMQTKKVQI